jgi:hypothetical protein
MIAFVFLPVHGTSRAVAVRMDDYLLLCSNNIFRCTVNSPALKKKKKRTVVQNVSIHCVSGFVYSISRIHSPGHSINHTCVFYLFRSFWLKYYCLIQGIQKISSTVHMWLFCIPGKPLGPGAPEGPGGPIGPGGPGVKVDSRTAVVSARTFYKENSMWWTFTQVRFNYVQCV